MKHHRPVAAAAVCATLVFDLAAATDFDEPRRLQPSVVLPAELVNGPSHAVLDDVTTVEGLNVFTVDSDWGPFEVYGEPLLRVRVHELSAIATLEQVSTAAAGGEAAGRAATRSLERIGQAIEDPVGTVKGIPGGVMRLFKSIGRDIGGLIEAGEDIYEEQKAGGPAEGETGAVEWSAVTIAREYAKISKNHREWAERVGVDPYSSNILLQNEIDRLAVTAAVADFGTSFILPDLPMVLGVIADVSDTVYRKDWRDLFEANRNMMTAMGVDEGTISRFEFSDALTPSVMTLIVANLDAMQGVAGRDIVVQQAALLETEAEALFFAECVLMARYYHEHESTLDEFLLETLIPVALDEDGRVVAFSAIDAASWDAQTASVARDFSAAYAAHGDARLLWIADYASPRFIDNMGALGWRVEHRLRQQVLPEIPWGIQEEAAVSE